MPCRPDLRPRPFALPIFAAVLLLSRGARAAERATYNSGGALTSLICDGAEIPVRGAFVAEFEGGVQATLQPHDQKSPIVRDGAALRWRGLATFANHSQARFTAAWTESDAGVHFDGTATAGGPPPAGGYQSPARAPLDLTTLDYVLDVPRAVFVGGAAGPSAARLTPGQPANPTVLAQTTDRVALVDAARNWTLTLQLDRARPVTVTDVWDDSGRSYRIRVSLHRGAWRPDDEEKLGFTVHLSGHASAAAARVTISPDKPRHAFDGFGGDYCFGTTSAAAAYTFEHLDIAWARCEFKADAWDRERGSPGRELQQDFALMQRLQQRHIPWVLSLWRLPERYYSDANRQPPGTFGRRIAADRWPEFAELLGSYLTYLKQTYGAEPDLFSFNEPDLGVDLGFTPETHRDTIRKLGAEFARLGLKTKLLLGDTANPRDTHRFVLAAAADPSAMRYVGAVSFHSWGSGTPEQYGAWADVAEWLHRPLLVAEAGVDPGAYRNLAYDSFAYGLREAAQYQDLLRYARPAALLYWEYTQDYGLVHVAADGAVAPTGRFWMIKQFSDLTPRHSQVVTTASDQADVLVSGFAKENAFTLQVLNTGPARPVTISGLPPGAYAVVQTTEDHGYERSAGPNAAAEAPVTLSLPARSLTTLVRETR